MSVILPQNPAPLQPWTNDFTGAKYYYDDGRIAWIFTGGVPIPIDPIDPGPPIDPPIDPILPDPDPDPEPEPEPEPDPELEEDSDYPVYISKYPPQSLDERKLYVFWLELPRYDLYVHVLDEDEGIDMYVSLNRNGSYKYVSNVGDVPPASPSDGNVLGNENGQTWFDTVSANFYVRWDDVWVGVTNNAYVDPSSGTVGFTEDIDQEILVLQNENASLTSRIKRLKSKITQAFGHVFEEEEEVLRAPSADTTPVYYKETVVAPGAQSAIINRYSDSEYRTGI